MSTVGSGEIANISMYMNRNQKPSFRRIIKENRIIAYSDAGSETTLYQKCRSSERTLQAYNTKLLVKQRVNQVLLVWSGKEHTTGVRKGSELYKKTLSDSSLGTLEATEVAGI